MVAATVRWALRAHANARIVVALFDADHMIIGKRSHKRLVGATFRVGTGCPPYGQRRRPASAKQALGWMRAARICRAQVGPSNNRFMRLKYVGLENAPNKTLFPARLTDILETDIGADQKIGEN